MRTRQVRLKFKRILGAETGDDFRMHLLVYIAGGRMGTSFQRLTS
jgi:hypothetical protein